MERQAHLNPLPGLTRFHSEVLKSELWDQTPGSIGSSRTVAGSEPLFSQTWALRVGPSPGTLTLLSRCSTRNPNCLASPDQRQLHRKARSFTPFYLVESYSVPSLERLHEMEDSNHQVSLSKTGIVFLCLYSFYLNGVGGTIVTEQVWS